MVSAAEDERKRKKHEFSGILQKCIYVTSEWKLHSRRPLRVLVHKLASQYRKSKLLYYHYQP